MSESPNNEAASNQDPAPASKDIFRMKYRELTEREKFLMADAKGKAYGLYATFDMEVDGLDHRCRALAKTKLEEAIMWYVKAITG